jgi:hypothetical protein
MYALPPANTASTFAFSPIVMPPQAAPVIPQQPVEQAAPTIVQRVSIEPVPARSDLLVEAENWSWAELRDYVTAQIISFFGAFPRDSRKEYGIFHRYHSTYGLDGVRVAEFAFGPVCEGWWGGAPISINRFCKASDPYFTSPILDRLAGRS